MIDGLILATIILILLLVLIFMRIDIAFAIGLVSVVWIIVGGYNPVVVVSRFFGQLDMFTLLAVPFFVLAGDLMNRSGITRTLINVANASVGRLRGGLAQSNVGGSLLFAGISGSAVADVAAIGKVIIPSMTEQGYDSDYSAAVTAASSIIGPIIPPSIILVIYAGLTNISVGGLFAAAIIPGILLGFSLMGAVAVQARMYDFPRYQKKAYDSGAVKFYSALVVAMIMPAIILFGILFGVFTATEAAAIACVYAVIVGVGYRKLDIKSFYNSIESSFDITAQIFIIIGFSGVISWLLAREGIPSTIVSTLTQMGVGPIVFMIIIVAILLITGTWLDIGAAIILLAPTLHTMAVDLGIPEMQFAMVMSISILMGLITPPVGLCLFVASSVSESPVWEISKKIVPFFVAQIIVIFLLILIPELTLYIPERLDLA